MFRCGAWGNRRGNGACGWRRSGAPRRPPLRPHRSDRAAGSPGPPGPSPPAGNHGRKPMGPAFSACPPHRKLTTSSRMSSCARMQAPLSPSASMIARYACVVTLARPRFRARKSLPSCLASLLDTCRHGDVAGCRCGRGEGGNRGHGASGMRKRRPHLGDAVLIVLQVLAQLLDPAIHGGTGGLFHPWCPLCLQHIGHQGVVPLDRHPGSGGDAETVARQVHGD